MRHRTQIFRNICHRLCHPISIIRVSFRSHILFFIFKEEKEKAQRKNDNIFKRIHKHFWKRYVLLAYSLLFTINSFKYMFKYLERFHFFLAFFL